MTQKERLEKANQHLVDAFMELYACDGIPLLIIRNKIADLHQQLRLKVINASSEEVST